MSTPLSISIHSEEEKKALMASINLFPGETQQDRFENALKLALKAISLKTPHKEIVEALKAEEDRKAEIVLGYLQKIDLDHEQALSAKKQVIATLSDDLERMKKENDELKQKIKMLEEKNNQENQTIAEKDRLIGEQGKEIMELKETIRLLHTQLNSIHVQEQREDQMENISQKLEALKREVQAMKQPDPAQTLLLK